MKKILVFTLVLLLLISCVKNTDPISSKSLPDLIIQDISYSFEGRRDSLYGGSNFYKFTLTISNIGNKELCESFYISNTRFIDDFENDYFSHGQIANYPKDTIITHETFTEIVGDCIPDETTYIKFLIATEGKQISHAPTFDKIEELNYDNNLYIVKIE